MRLGGSFFLCYGNKNKKLGTNWVYNEGVARQ